MRKKKNEKKYNSKNIYRMDEERKKFRGMRGNLYIFFWGGRGLKKLFLKGPLLDLVF